MAINRELVDAGIHNIRGIVPLLLLLLLLGLTAGAQTDDWRAVQKLTPGTHISVKAGFRFLCVFQEATDDALVCEAPQRNLIRTGRSTYTVARSSVREARLEHTDTSNAAFGALVGGGAGAAIGASVKNRTPDRVKGALLLGGVGALLGGGLGRDFPILHGEVVYKRK